MYSKGLMDINSQANLLLAVSCEIIHFFCGIAINFSVERGKVKVRFKFLNALVPMFQREKNKSLPISFPYREGPSSPPTSLATSLC